MFGVRHIRTSSFVKDLPLTCPGCGRKIQVKWVQSFAPIVNLDHREVTRVKIDGSNGNGKNGKSKAKSMRELEETSINV